VGLPFSSPVNPSHPHRIHLIALSQLLSEVRNGVSPSQEKELLKEGTHTKKTKKNQFVPKHVRPSCRQLVFGHLNREILTAS